MKLLTTFMRTRLGQRLNDLATGEGGRRQDLQLLDLGNNRRARREILRQHRDDGGRVTYDPESGYPAPRWRGAQRPYAMASNFKLAQRPFYETSFSVATALVFLAGGALGSRGGYIGRDTGGGGAFTFDPWELYARKVITGMSMIIMGTVGTGKSTCAKSVVTRLVQHGRKALVLADRKGEWDSVAAYLGGATIHVGPGLKARINPLDAGLRPSTDPDGQPMTDALWSAMVRARRLNLLQAMGFILLGRKIKDAEHTALSKALDDVVAAAGEGSTPIIPDVTVRLRAMAADKGLSVMTREGAELLAHNFARMSEGDLSGMFDGPSTVSFDADLPILTINTRALTGVSPEARKIAYAATGSWAESMIHNADSGQRVCVYEEGWDSISDEASLTRMLEAWKLARDYNIFNILIFHKLGDLDIAGDAGSAMAAMARSLLGDTEIKVIYRQENANLATTAKELGLTTAEVALVKKNRKGVGLWKVGTRSLLVRNDRTATDVPVFDTDAKMLAGMEVEAA